MKEKNKLLQLYKRLLYLLKLNRNMLEEEGKDVLKNHPLGNQNMYRFHYMNYYELGKSSYGSIEWAFEIFKLPQNITRDEAFKIFSYFKDYIQSYLNIENGVFEKTSLLDDIIKKLGFKKVTNYIDDDECVIDLFVIEGRKDFFKKTDFYEKYYNWYSPNIKFDEIKKIFDKASIPFDNSAIDEVIKNKTLKKTKETC